MPENPQNNKDHNTPPPQYPPQPIPPYYYEEEDEISLLDMLLVLARNRMLILKTIGVFLVLGLIIAVFSSAEYSSSATLIRETTEGASTNLGGLASLGRGLGLNIGGTTQGLTAEAYPDILKSREVRLAVVRDNYYFRDVGDSLSLTDYFIRKKGFLSKFGGFIKDYTIGLPGKILHTVKGTQDISPVMTFSGEPVYPTEDEEDAMKALSGMLSVSVDQETGLMTVKVTTGDPLLSASLADGFIKHLTDRVRAIRTKKARENLEFIQGRFNQAQEELNQAEEELAAFDDRNQNPSTARLRTERERLSRRVNFKQQLFSDLQTQLTQAEIELQRSEPVITVVEQPVPPLEKSGPNRKLIVILSLFLGGGLGVGLAFVKQFVGNMETDDEESGKLREIKEAFIPERWRNHGSGSGSTDGVESTERQNSPGEET